ncbi:MAG: lysophospholipid acyltransferase family protein [Armatimonadetes bacterium]|nr:lysophospholipid acyltransferase family protein [Armatimonadota bacterium]
MGIDYQFPAEVLQPPTQSTWKRMALGLGRKVKRSQAPLWGEVKFWLLARFMWVVVNLIMLTCRVRIGGRSVLAQHWREGGVIFVLWHSKTFIPVHFFRGRGVHTLISLSKDGHYQSNIFRFFGWSLIRGSSSRGGSEALRHSIKVLRRGGRIGFTPDGPKGPPRQVQPGVVLMASLSRKPIIPVGIAASGRRLLSTWDRYMIPKPFSTTSMHFGEPIYIPSDLPREIGPEYLEQIRTGIEDAERRAGELVER